MLSWDDQRLKSIAFDDGYGDDGVHEVFSSQQIHSYVVSTPGHYSSLDPHTEASDFALL